MTNEELLKIYFDNKHILQSRPWGEFKTSMGTRAITIGNAQVTMHKIPFTPWKVGYCPKIRPEDLDLEKLYGTAKKEGYIFVKIDVPHALHDYQLPTTNPVSAGPRSGGGYQITLGKPIFARSTILMDLTKNDDELSAAMHEKTRYNLRLSQKKGVKIEVFSDPEKEETQRALEEFVNLQKRTASRQKFFIHPDNYYRTCFRTLSAKKMAYLVSAKVGTETAASWVLFHYGDVLYYPYGESNYNLRTFMASNLVMWEAIKLGKKLNCKVFDLWGAADDPSDEKDPWHGFTRFKLSFGGAHVKLAPTHDLIINKPLYNVFNLVDTIRWKILRAKNG